MKIFNFAFKGELYLKPKLSMFCALFQNYEYFDLKHDISILKQIVWET